MTLSSHMRNFWPQNKVRGYLCHKWRVASWYTSVQACSKHTYDKDVTRDSKEDVDRQDEQEKTHGQKIPSALRAIFLAEKDSAQALWIAREEAAKNSERSVASIVNCTLCKIAYARKMLHCLNGVFACGTGTRMECDKGSRMKLAEWLERCTI
jgi:hypothetical protein